MEEIVEKKVKKATKKTTAKAQEFLGTGRRKCSVARVRITTGSGKIEINGKTIDEYFKMVKFKKEDGDRLMRDYSHGMKSKLQMLVYIISSPKVILLDEPLTSFDVVVAEEMKQLLKEHHVHL